MFRHDPAFTLDALTSKVNEVMATNV